MVFGGGIARKRHKRYQTQQVRFDLLSRVLNRLGILRAVQRDDAEILEILMLDD